MGNGYSKWHDLSKSIDTAPIHLTLFLPVFGLPNHVESFILSSSVPYPDDPLFGAFVLSPWFEQIPNKLSNEEFLEKYKPTDRYADNYVPDKRFSWNDTTKVYEPTNSTAPVAPTPLRVELEEEPNLIELGSGMPWSNSLRTRQPDEPEGLHYRPKRFDLDTSQYPVIIPRTTTSNKSEKTKGVPCKDQMDVESFPSHVPFFKIGLPQPQNFIKNNAFFRSNNDVAQLWKDPVHPYEYSHFHDLGKSKVLPFRGLGIRQKFSTFDYNFKKSEKKPYTGLGGDGIKTEYEIFSQYNYPRKSLIAVRSLDGYSLDTIAYLPHVDTIPAHHLGTILILDMVSEDAVTILSQFITKTLEFLQRGCILPLTNVDIWVLQLNAEKLDGLVMGNDFILEKLTEIGFDLSHIHLCPYEMSPFYALPSPAKYAQPPHYHHEDYPPLRAFPLLSKPSLTHFLTPIWNAVYLKTFQLHQEGHWDRLVNRSIKNNPKIRFIPPTIFPTNEYQMLHNSHYIYPKLLQKQLIDAMKSFDPRYHHVDDQAIALTLTFSAMYRTFQIKAREYFGPLLIKEQKKLNPKKNDDNTDAILPDSTDEFQPGYELLFNDKEPLWDNPRSYFPHIKKVSQFVQNPKPLHFIPEYNPAVLNNGRPLPNQYRAPFVKKLARALRVEESESESDHGGDDDVDDDESKGSKKIYPKFYTSQSIWPMTEIEVGGNQIDTVEKDDQAIRNVKNSQNLPVSPTTQLPPAYTLSDQIISLGLPKRYEFESFILWGDQAVIADQHNMFEFGYFYEPHVQGEIMQAVDQIKSELSQQMMSSNSDKNDLQTHTSQTTAPPTPSLYPSSYSNTQSVPPTTVLETLLPTSILPRLSKTDYPTPFQYLLLTSPNKLSRYYPATDYYRSKFVMPVWTTCINMQKRLNDQIYSRLLSRLLGHLHILPRDQYSFFSNHRPITRLTEKHIVPPILRQKHYTAVAPLSYAHTRVEFGFSGGDVKINRELVDKGNGGKNKGEDVYSFNQPTAVGSAQEQPKTATQIQTEAPTPSLIDPSFESLNQAGVPIDPIHSTELLPPATSAEATVPAADMNSLGGCAKLTSISSPLDSTSRIKPATIEIGLTYLHRCTASTTVYTQTSLAKKDKDQCFYVSHPLVSSVSFLPLAWLHGIFIVPFVYIASRTKLIKQKFNLSEVPIFLNRPLEKCHYPTNPTQLPQLLGHNQDPKEAPKPHTPDSLPFSPLSPPNNTFRSYPPGFIPPPIPPFPLPGRPWAQSGFYHGIDQNKSAQRIVDGYRKASQKSEHKNSSNLSNLSSLPFTIPLVLPRLEDLNELLPRQGDYSMMDPCHNSHYAEGSCIPAYHAPITFIILITNPIYPDPVPYSNIEIPHQVMGSEDQTPLQHGKRSRPITQHELKEMFYKDVSDPKKDEIEFTADELHGDELDNIYDGYDEIPHIKTTIPYFRQHDFPGVSTATGISAPPAHPGLPGNSPQLKVPTPIDDLPSLIEPITQSQFRYYQEYIPMLYKRQLTEQIYGHGLMGSTPAKLQKLWTVEVHTPYTLKAAMKRIEQSAVETRLKIYRDLALCLQHDDEEKRKKAEKEQRLF